MAMNQIYCSSHLFAYSCEVKGATDNYLVVYDVSRFSPKAGQPAYRNWACTCPHFANRCVDSGEFCKHIWAVMALKPEEGGMSTWVQDDMSDPFFGMSGEQVAHLKEWNSYAMQYGAQGLAENAGAMVDALKTLVNGLTPYVPGLIYNGQLVQAVSTTDYRNMTVVPQIAVDLNYGVTKAKLLADHEAQLALAAANPAPQAKRAAPLPPPQPMPQKPPQPYRPSAPAFPTPKKPGGI